VKSVRRLAALYDIHGNLPALEVVVAELYADPPDAVVVGGDVAAGPMPAQVLTLLRSLPWPVHWLRGNADRVVVMGFDGTIASELLEHPLFRGDAWAATFLGRRDRDFLDCLPPLLVLAVDGVGEVLFCHGTSRSDEERVTTATPPQRLARVLAEAGAEVMVGGHTHRQFDRAAGGRRMINAGSVGRPYENQPGAYWLTLGPGVQLRRTSYDTTAADAAFRATGYPAAELMLAPVDADAVAESYERSSDRPVSAASRIEPADNPLRAATKLAGEPRAGR
jgi:predicted phosphodiesterase